MTERRAPTTAKVAGMILTHKNDPNAHHTPGGGREMSAGTYNVTISKGWEPVVFPVPFTGPDPPSVVVTCQDVAGGKKVGQKDATTTGFDITAEALVDCDWQAMEKG